MLKNFFISMLGALAAFWISIMLLFLLSVGMVVTIVAKAALSSAPEVDVKSHSVLSIDLEGSIEERSQAPSIDMYSIISGPGSPSMGLDNLVNALSAAKTDKNIDGLYLHFNGVSAGYATVARLRQAIADFSKSGKWVVTYSDSYDQGDIYIASAASNRFLNPAGMVNVRGIGGAVPFYKGLMDKLGIEMQVLKVGTFKSAVEPYLHTEMSEPARMQMRVYMDNIWQYVSGEMAKSFSVEPAQINQWADSMIMCDPAQKILDLGIVTGLKYEHEVDDYIKTLTDTDKDDDVDYVDYLEYLSSSSAKVPHEKNNKNKIAVYYAFGEIVDTGDKNISAEQMVPEILDLAEDEDIAGLVLRVNSPGGSAFASEQIWEALQQFKQAGKPLYVSMGDYAASGGYYISCGADKIFAQPVTITGSIGIYGMVPCFHGLLTDKLGVNFSFVQTNPNAVAPNLINPMTPFQRARMQQRINDGYDLFTSRCAKGRHISQDSIKVIAEGRVWDGQEALKIGLVDQLGTLDDAVAAMAKKLNFKDYQVLSYPSRQKKIWDYLLEMQSDMETRSLRTQLGAAYPMFMEIKQIGQQNPVQARLPYQMVE